MPKTTYVDFTTSLGDIVIQLFDTDAPLTVANFVSYARNMIAGQGYTSSFFHRLVTGFVLQGGGYTVQSGAVGTIAAQAAVPNEFSATHPNVAGTVAMAKLGNDPNSATDQFFFNLGDNSSNLDAQNGGFTVFGQVTAASWPVVQTIAALPTVNLSSGLGTAFTQVPVQNYAAGTTVQTSNLVTINQVSVAVEKTAADFDGNGTSDLLLQNSNGAGMIYTTNGLGVTGMTSLGNPGPSWHIMGSADFNGDGQADVLFQNDDGSVIAFLMNGTSISQGVDLGRPGAAWHVRGFGDFNADGMADVLMQSDGGSMVVLETNGTNLIGSALIGSIPSGWGVEGVADFNGDGQPDLLVQSVDGTLVDFTMNGTSVTAGTVVGNYGKDYSVAGTGDYNSDGKADILLHNDSGANLLLAMNGAVVTNTVGLGNSGTDFRTAVAGVDLDGNGTSDLVVQNSANSTLVGFTLNTTASITAGAVLGMPGSGWNAVGANPIAYTDGTGASLVATPGQDQFVLTTAAAGAHTITGFNPAQDSLALSIAAFPDLATVQAHEAAFQGGTFLGLSPTSAVVIAGVTPDQLGSANFILR